jgi:hypothetical protein
MPDRTPASPSSAAGSAPPLLAVCARSGSGSRSRRATRRAPQSLAPVAGVRGHPRRPVGLGVFLPRIGGLLAVAAACFAAWFFDSSGARLLLALPLVVAGVGLCLSGPWAWRPRLGRAKPDGGVTPG